MIRTLIVEDHAMVRTGLRLVLERQPDICVVGEAQNGQEALECVEELEPDLLLLDLGLPDIDGVEVLERVKERHPSLHVLILSGLKNEQYLLRAMRSGASGFILKQGTAADLVRSVRAVAQGNLVVEWAGSSDAVELGLFSARQRRLLPQHSVLTKRERDVLRLVAQGHSNAEIAARLGISAKTVDTHRTHVMDKLDVHSRADLTRYALQHGYLVVA
jgi:two-component system response regulator NreC